MDGNKKKVREFLRQSGIGIVGFGEVPHDMETLEIPSALPRAVVFGHRLSGAVLATIHDRPTLLYKHHYKAANWVLDQAACRLADFIQSRGYAALPIPASQTIDWNKQRGHLSHKRLALEAGVGFRGRSGLLIHPEFGAGVRYVSVLTDMDFSPDEKAEGSCGACRKCLPACPAGAIGEEGVDLDKCLEKLKEFAKIRGVAQYICGVCVRACNGGR